MSAIGSSNCISFENVVTLADLEDALKEAGEVATIKFQKVTTEGRSKEEVDQVVSTLFAKVSDSIYIRNAEDEPFTDDIRKANIPGKGPRLVIFHRKEE